MVLAPRLVAYLRALHEAEIETTPEGKVPVGGGWFVLNLGEMA